MSNTMLADKNVQWLLVPPMVMPLLQVMISLRRVAAEHEL